MKPSARLVSWTHDPVETIYSLWEASKTNKPIRTVAEIKAECAANPEFNAEVRGLFRKIITDNIPLAENLNFVFILDNVSIAFREQMVRHRIGVKIGDRLGVDMFPDVHDSTWWSQSMRVLNMGNFADNEGYHIPTSIAKNETARDYYKHVMDKIQDSYNRLSAMGIPDEDARMVIPLAATHRISWGMNLTTMSHIIHKRSCWVAQLDLWRPVIASMLDEVCAKVDPLFSLLATPPCLRGNTFTGCVHKADSEERVQGRDPLPPCALYLKHVHAKENPLFERQQPDYDEMCADYAKFWRRDVHSGEAEVSK
jgi:thymidylate synthase (FAD)